MGSRLSSRSLCPSTSLCEVRALSLAIQSGLIKRAHQTVALTVLSRHLRLWG